MGLNREQTFIDFQLAVLECGGVDRGFLEPGILKNSWSSELSNGRNAVSCFAEQAENETMHFRADLVSETEYEDSRAFLGLKSRISGVFGA